MLTEQTETVVKRASWPVEYQVAWRMCGCSGCGLWHPAVKRDMLQLAVDDGNRRYGPGTHWLNSRNA